MVRGVNDAQVGGGTAEWLVCVSAPAELEGWVEVLWVGSEDFMGGS